MQDNQILEKWRGVCGSAVRFGRGGVVRVGVGERDVRKKMSGGRRRRRRKRRLRRQSRRWPRPIGMPLHDLVISDNRLTSELPRSLCNQAALRHFYSPPRSEGFRHWIATSNSTPAAPPAPSPPRWEGCRHWEAPSTSTPTASPAPSQPRSEGCRTSTSTSTTSPARCRRSSATSRPPPQLQVKKTKSGVVVLSSFRVLS